MAKRNQRFLNEFQAWLDAKGLTEKTIENHVSNADFYINEYLTREDGIRMEDGTFRLDGFFRYFFIRKCLWSTPAAIKTMAASVKKFYRCMMELGHISPSDYAFVCSEIKDGLPEWQRECNAYNYGEDWEEDDSDFIPWEDMKSDQLMPTDYMYDLAFAFKTAKPWMTVFEEEIFAVQLPGGRIGYCCVMGRGGNHIALSLYPGEEAFDTFYRLLELDPLESMAARSQDLLLQDCIQLSLENKDFLEEDDVASVRAYAKKRGVTLRGPHTYPNFSRYYPHCIPWFITAERDQKDLITALEATLALTRFLKDHEKDDICLRSVYDEPEEIPLFEKKDDDNFRIRLTPLPASVEKRYPEPASINDVSLAKLKRLKQKGVLECEVIRSPAPVRGDGEDAPYFPAMLLSVDHKTGMVYRLVAAEGRNYDPDELLHSTIETLLQAGIYPKEIWIRTEETEALLRKFCGKAGIKLTAAEELAELDEAVNAMEEDLGAGMGGFDPDEIEGTLAEMIDSLSGMSDAELRSMPGEMIDAIMMLLEGGMLPQTLAKRVRRLFGN